jgi:colanic acid/amylovoran biosynthesis glycosyltransferase
MQAQSSSDNSPLASSQAFAGSPDNENRPSLDEHAPTTRPNQSTAMTNSTAVLTAEPSARSGNARVRLAYLLSTYPAVSQTFLLNEIRSLRKFNFEIATASINPCDSLLSQLGGVERAEEESTFYLKRAGVWGALWAFADAVLRNPLGLLRGLFYVIRMGGSGIRFFYLIEALMVGKWMRERGLSHLHSHFGGAVSSVAMIAARTFPVTLSFTIHGPDEFYDVRKFYLAEKIKTASFVFCIGTFTRSQLMMLSPVAQWNKLLVSRLGVDPLKFNPPQRRKSSGPIEILSVGRLVGAKGQHVLLAAFRRLVREGRNVRLRVVGDGPDRKSLETAAAQDELQSVVTFEGAVGADRVRCLLESADIFALPSFAEGIPVALMEAMAMEVPCVSTTISGIPELIRSETEGILVAPADEDQLAVALARLIDNPDLRERLGRAGRRRVEENFDLHRNVEKLAEMFRCLV